MSVKNKLCMIDVGDYLASLQARAPWVNNQPIDSQKTLAIFSALHDEAFGNFFSWSNKIYFLYPELSKIYGHENVYQSQDSVDSLIQPWVDDFDCHVCDPIVTELTTMLNCHFPNPEDRHRDCYFEINNNYIQYLLRDSIIKPPSPPRTKIKVGRLLFSVQQSDDVKCSSAVLQMGQKTYDHNAWRNGYLVDAATETPKPTQESPISVTFNVINYTHLSDYEMQQYICQCVQTLMNKQRSDVVMTIIAADRKQFYRYMELFTQISRHTPLRISFRYQEERPWGDVLQRTTSQLNANIKKHNHGLDDHISAIKELENIRQRILSRKTKKLKKVTEFDYKHIRAVTPEIFNISVNTQTLYYRLYNEDGSPRRDNTILDGGDPRLFDQNELVLLAAIEEYLDNNRVDEQTNNHVTWR